MKVFVDFDRVAFNTGKLYEFLEGEDVPEFGTEESLIYIEETHGPLEDLLYDDFKSFAMTQRTLGNEIILVTSAHGLSNDWEIQYQKKKVEMSGILNYVSKSITVPDGKADAISSELKDGDRAVFVDDSDEHLRAVKRVVENIGFEKLNFECLQMVRESAARTSRGVERIALSEECKQISDFNSLARMFPELQKKE